MSYCTLEEAWGNDFTNEKSIKKPINNTQTGTETPNTTHTPKITQTHHSPRTTPRAAPFDILHSVP